MYKPKYTNYEKLEVSLGNPGTCFGKLHRRHSAPDRRRQWTHSNRKSTQTMIFDFCWRMAVINGHPFILFACLQRRFWFAYPRAWRTCALVCLHYPCMYRLYIYAAHPRHRHSMVKQQEKGSAPFGWIYLRPHWQWGVSEIGIRRYFLSESR